MAFVLDCSVAMAWVFPDEASDATGRLRDSLIKCAVIPRPSGQGYKARTPWL